MHFYWENSNFENIYIPCQANRGEDFIKGRVPWPQAGYGPTALHWLTCPSIKTAICRAGLPLNRFLLNFSSSFGIHREWMDKHLMTNHYIIASTSTIFRASQLRTSKLRASTLRAISYSALINNAISVWWTAEMLCKIDNILWNKSKKSMRI